MATSSIGGGSDNEMTIQRHAVGAETGFGLFVYRTDDGRFLTLDEASNELTRTMAEGLEGLPPENQVIDGGDVEEFLFESGIYGRVEVQGRVVAQYTDGWARWTDEQLREKVFPTSDHDDLEFEQWKVAQVRVGALTMVDVLQFVGYEDEDADEETVVTERLIID